MKEILFFEPDTEGHSQEWLQNLAEYVAADKTAATIWAVVSPTLYNALTLSMPVGSENRVRYVALKPREMKWCTHRSLLIEAFARWWTMRKYLARTGADGGFYLSLDLLCIPLALGLRARGKPIAGVLFRPSVHYASIGKYEPSWAEKLRDLRKNILYRLMLKNPSVTMLSLDPYFPEYAKSHYEHGDKVGAVCEPSHNIKVENRNTQVDFVPPGRIGLILFGYITERKGPLVVLEAMRLLRPAIANRLALLFAGRVDPTIRESIDARCKALARDRPELWLRIEDRRFDEGELDLLVTRSDIVLAPYQRFVGSSGILIWAARAGNPVLAQDYGLVGKLTQVHGLGTTVDSSDPEKLAVRIEQMVLHGPKNFIDPRLAAAFVASNTSQRFASTMLSSFGARELMD
jgi:glycosyltransferase involved in cell wall biosynthesis